MPATSVACTAKQHALKLWSLGSAILHTEMAKFVLLLHKLAQATCSLKAALEAGG